MNEPNYKQPASCTDFSMANSGLQTYNDELEWSINHLGDEDDVIDGKIDLSEFLESNDFLQAMEAITEEEAVRNNMTNGEQQEGCPPVGESTHEVPVASRFVQPGPTTNQKRKHTSTFQEKQHHMKEHSEKKQKTSSGAIRGPSHRNKKKPNGFPKRPLSAYNMFFRSERPKIFQEGKLIDHRIGFEELGRTIGRRWRALDAASREEFERLAELDVARYRKEMDAYNGNRREKRIKKTPIKKEPSLLVPMNTRVETPTSPRSLIIDSPRKVTPMPKSPRETVKSFSLQSDSSGSIMPPTSPRGSYEREPPRIMMRLPDPYSSPSVGTPPPPPPPPPLTGYGSQSTHGPSPGCSIPSYPYSKASYEGVQYNHGAQSSLGPFFTGGSEPGPCGTMSALPQHRLVRRFSEPPPLSPRFEPFGAIPRNPSFPADPALSDERAAQIAMPPPKPVASPEPFDSGKEVVLPDPVTGIRRSYKIIYKCYRMTKAEANSFMKQCCPPGSSESAPNQISLEQMLKAPEPPGEEVSFPFPGDNAF